jgi:hypothetical protein
MGTLGAGMMALFSLVLRGPGVVEVGVAFAMVVGVVEPTARGAVVAVAGLPAGGP